MTRDADERDLVAKSAADLLTQLGGLKRVRRVRDAWPATDTAAWQAMAGAGWVGALVPESRGGAGMGPADVVALLEGAGEFLPPEPLAPAIAAAAALAACTEPAAGPLLEGALSGERIVLPALDADAVEGIAGDPVALRAGTLSGEMQGIADGHLATDLLVCATTTDGVPLLVAIQPSQPGVALKLERTVDGGSIGVLALRDVALEDVRTVARGDAARAALHAMADLAGLGRAALLVGLMQAALRLTVDYLKTRHQFGRPIGANQSLQHRAASAQIDLTVTRALVREAARAVGAASQHRAAAAAAARASAAALRTCKECVQLHGAIGFTDEYDIGLYLRRAMALAGAAGGDANLGRFVAYGSRPAAHL